MAIPESTPSGAAMKPRIVFRREAAAELESSWLWYENERRGLGDEFLKSVDDTLARIQNAPDSYQVVQRDIRQLMVPRFPFAIYYSFAADEIVILSVFHCSRDPAKWQSRSGR